MFDVGETLVDESRGELYPDALECVEAVRQCGLVVGIAANQPAGLEKTLRAMGLDADFVGASAEWGVSKPDSAFFERVVGEAGVPAEAILYVGDRVDNDVLPARAAGMRTVHLLRGRWGYVHAQQQESALADLRVESLQELTGWLRRGAV